MPVSALKRTNLDKLLETIQLQAEVLDLEANPHRVGGRHRHRSQARARPRPVGDRARAARHAARRRHRRGRHGVGPRTGADRRHTASNVVGGGPRFRSRCWASTRAPEAGDPFAVVESEARAREITDYRVRKRRETLGSARTPSARSSR